MKSKKIVSIAFVFSILAFDYEWANAQSKQDFRYDIYEMAESGITLRVPKNLTRSDDGVVHVEKISAGNRSVEEAVEEDVVVYEMAESGMLIEFRDKSESRDQESNHVERISSSGLNSDGSSDEEEYDVYGFGESGILIQYPLEKNVKDRGNDFIAKFMRYILFQIN